MRTPAITSAQIRGARALLQWTAVDLARESSVGVNTIRRAEVAENGTSLTAANELAIRRALEAAGIEFIDENGGGPGVRLRERQLKKEWRCGSKLGASWDPTLEVKAEPPGACPRVYQESGPSSVHG